MELTRKFGGKKYMWDGRTYQTPEEAEEFKKNYQSDGFEVEVIGEDEQWVAFTRRVVTEIIIDDQPI